MQILPEQTDHLILKKTSSKTSKYQNFADICGVISETKYTYVIRETAYKQLNLFTLYTSCNERQWQY